jgi:NADP-reducing hydrogenase subunit HndB
MGTCGIAAGAREIMDALLDEMKKKKATDVVVTTSGCAGLCNREPMATVELKDQPPVKYFDLTPAGMLETISSSLINLRRHRMCFLRVLQDQRGPRKGGPETEPSG